MRALLRKYRLYFTSLTVAAFALRFYFYLKYPIYIGDSLFYGELAKNWLRHGILGVSDGFEVHPSIVRLPGYPGFMAAIWSIAGVEHYHAVLVVQIFFSVATCFLMADLALRTLRSERGAKVAFLLTALCPFFANYAAVALTETLAIFFTALAFDFAAMAISSGRWSQWAGSGLAICAGIYMRPDDGIILPVLGTFLMVQVFKGPTRRERMRNFWAAVILSAAALAPLIPWTLRNWSDFHVFQPLVPQSAAGPGEFEAVGYGRWVETWLAEYTSVAEITFAEGDGTFDLTKLPSRAFDTRQERERTAALFNAYNKTTTVTPEIDRQFGQLADERIQRHPLRYYIVLPAARLTDMWLRPRTEMVGVDDRWWEFDDPSDSSISITLGLINLFYVITAAVAVFLPLWRRPDPEPDWRCWWVLLSFALTRSLFLTTIGNAEPRYTLEAYPVVIVLAAMAFSSWRSQKTNAG